MRWGALIVIAAAACSSSPHRPPGPIAGAPPPPPPGPRHDLAVGGTHACARTHAGTVMCWGLNEFGQLGDGTHDDRYAPFQVAGLTGVAGVSAGREHTCAWTDAGAVWCWGGIGAHDDNEIQLVPKRIEQLADVVEVDAGETSSCARTKDGRVWCFTWWTFVGGIAPVEIAEAKDATAVAVGKFQACAVLATGGVGCWELPTGYGEGVKPMVAIAGVSPAAIDAEVDLDDHFLGSTGSGHYQAWQVQLGGETKVVDPPAVPAAVEVGIGYDFGCARPADGDIQCWSMTDGEMLGLPEPVPGTAGAVQLVVGANGPWDGHTAACASYPDGSVKCWGPASQLGNGGHDWTTSAIDVHGIDDVVEIAAHADADATCARRRNGDVSCWGVLSENWHGGMDGPIHHVPFATGIAGATAIYATDGGLCAKRGDQPGNCRGEKEMTLLPVAGPVLAFGGLDACALDAKGVATCVSDTPEGDEPAPAPEDRTIPPGVGKLDRLWLGYETGCAVQRGKPRKLVCWFRDQQSGSATMNQRFVAAMAGEVVDVAVSTDASCFVRPDKTVGCVLATAPFGPAQDVPGITDATAIAAGFGGFCVLHADATVSCWGEVHRRNGEVAINGTFTEPVVIDNLSDAVQLVGHEHALCALRKTGRVACWGDRDYVGDGGGVRAGPVVVTGVTL